MRVALALLLLWPAGAIAAQEADRIGEAESVLSTLVETYGVSGMESPVRDAVRRMLPGWARSEVDSAGNIWVRAGQGEPTVVMVAHLDEIGFSVTAIGEDGILTVEPVGGIFPRLWAGRPALVHGGRAPVPAVFQPLDTAVAASEATTLRVDLGVTTRAAVGGARRQSGPHRHQSQGSTPASPGAGRPRARSTIGSAPRRSCSPCNDSTPRSCGTR